MVEVRELHPTAARDLAAVRDLHAAAQRADGHPSLNDDVWLDLDSGGRDGSAGAFARERSSGELAGFAHVAPAPAATPPIHWEAGLVLALGARDGTVCRMLLKGLLAHVAARGGGEVVLWLLAPDTATDAAALDVGFAPSRELRQMTVPLPLAESPRWPDSVTARSFVPGEDDEAWLHVNNRAFAGHPEQGGWSLDTLHSREAEPWFDPEGLLLAFDAEGLAGSCWTKLHADDDSRGGPVGEIFVIGVDPSRQGTGLGRALVVAGLASIAERGVTRGMLFVDAANAPAVGLYDALGFRTERLDRAYTRRVAPA